MEAMQPLSCDHKERIEKKEKLSNEKKGIELCSGTVSHIRNSAGRGCICSN